MVSDESSRNRAIISRVTPVSFPRRVLENYLACATGFDALVARRDRLMRLDLTFGEAPDKWQLELKTEATAAQRQHLDSWLGKTDE